MNGIDSTLSLYIPLSSWSWDEATRFMFKIENLMLHCYNNGETEFYSATLRNNNESKNVRLYHNGTIFYAHEQSTDLIYHLTLDSKIQSLKDLRDGDEVEIFMTISPDTIS